MFFCSFIVEFFRETTAHRVGGIGRYRKTIQFAWIAFTIHNVPLGPRGRGQGRAPTTAKPTELMAPNMAVIRAISFEKPGPGPTPSQVFMWASILANACCTRRTLLLPVLALARAVHTGPRRGRVARGAPRR